MFLQGVAKKKKRIAKTNLSPLLARAVPHVAHVLWGLMLMAIPAGPTSNVKANNPSPVHGRNKDQMQWVWSKMESIANIPILELQTWTNHSCKVVGPNSNS
jgi:hypothetical protein